MVKEELNTAAGTIGLAAILAIMIILLAVLALVVVKALAESPWGVFTVGATIPIAMFMGGYLRFWRVGQSDGSLGDRRRAAAAGGVGRAIRSSTPGAGGSVHAERRDRSPGSIIVYGFAASVLPVWLLLAPRDYLSTFMKLGTIFALALGVFLVLPDLQMPALTKFVDGSGLVVAGKLFPFCFITIACGAISGFHTLISSGTTPKIITRESYARPIGYGAMCLESLVAIMAMIAACTLDPGVYLSMNIKGEGATPAEIATDTVAKVQGAGFHCHRRADGELAKRSRRENAVRPHGRRGHAGRRHGADFFASRSRAAGCDLWYHFAIMFEALVHSDDARCRHARRTLFAAGCAGKLLEAARRHQAHLQ